MMFIKLNPLSHSAVLTGMRWSIFRSGARFSGMMLELSLKSLQPSRIFLSLSLNLWASCFNLDSPYGSSRGTGQFAGKITLKKINNKIKIFIIYKIQIFINIYIFIGLTANRPNLIKIYFFVASSARSTVQPRSPRLQPPTSHLQIEALTQRPSYSEVDTPKPEFNMDSKTLTDFHSF